MGPKRWELDPAAVSRARAIGDRIRTLRTKKDWTQAQLGEKAGLSPETISRAEQAKFIPAGRTLHRLAKGLGVDLETLLGGRTELPRSRGLANGGEVHQPEEAAPVFDIGADYDRDWSDGDFPVGHGDRYMGLPIGISQEHAFYCEVHGDSMEPEIHDGDLVLFSPDQGHWEEGSICLVRTAEGATLKRVYSDGHSHFRLVPSNRQYREWTVKRAAVIQLQQVVAVTHYMVKIHPVVQPMEVSGS